VVEGHAALVQEALLSHLGGYGAQAHLAALGSLAAQRPGKGTASGLVSDRLLLAFAGSHTLSLASSRQLGDEAGLLELSNGPQDLADEDGSRGVFEEECRR
jgi:hypothetical protein